ncbi:MAG: S-layer homology domain-containing protein [Methylacidiphilales bacterium]|nr:S-layer homology domain-containing protein [Candidatus Methylacidiphilales bacterium]NJR18914.1 S-layer homology domain-containing protein [Calothrix sp. CSU_2_0]
MRQIFSTLSLLVFLQTYSLGIITVTPVAAQDSDPISQVVAANLMRNFADGKFYPERMISRAELATIMVKAFKLDKRQGLPKENVTVADVPASHWAFNDIQTVLKTGIMRGYRDNLFFPNQQVTRAEAIAIFAQAYGVFQFPDDTVSEILAPYPDRKSIPTWARKAIATVISEGFITPDNQGNLLPLKPMTRGDVAYLLSRYLQRQQKQPETPIVPEIPPTQ